MTQVLEMRVCATLVGTGEKIDSGAQVHTLRTDQVAYVEGYARIAERP